MIGNNNCVRPGIYRGPRISGIQNAFDDPEMIKTFDVDGYRYNPNISSDNDWIFTRKS